MQRTFCKVEAKGRGKCLSTSCTYSHHPSTLLPIYENAVKPEFVTWKQACTLFRQDEQYGLWVLKYLPEDHKLRQLLMKTHSCGGADPVSQAVSRINSYKEKLRNEEQDKEEKAERRRRGRKRKSKTQVEPQNRVDAAEASKGASGWKKQFLDTCSNIEKGKYSCDDLIQNEGTHNMLVVTALREGWLENLKHLPVATTAKEAMLMGKVYQRMREEVQYLNKKQLNRIKQENNIGQKPKKLKPLTKLHYEQREEMVQFMETFQKGMQNSDAGSSHMHAEEHIDSRAAIDAHPEFGTGIRAVKLPLRTASDEKRDAEEVVPATSPGKRVKSATESASAEAIDKRFPFGGDWANLLRKMDIEKCRMLKMLKAIFETSDLSGTFDDLLLPVLRKGIRKGEKRMVDLARAVENELLGNAQDVPAWFYNYVEPLLALAKQILVQDPESPRSLTGRGSESASWQDCAGNSTLGSREKQSIAFVDSNIAAPAQPTSDLSNDELGIRRMMWARNIAIETALPACAEIFERFWRSLKYCFACECAHSIEQLKPACLIALVSAGDESRNLLRKLELADKSMITHGSWYLHFDLGQMVTLVLESEQKLSESFVYSETRKELTKLRDLRNSSLYHRELLTETMYSNYKGEMYNALQQLYKELDRSSQDLEQNFHVAEQHLTRVSLRKELDAMIAADAFRLSADAIDGMLKVIGQHWSIQSYAIAHHMCNSKSTTTKALVFTGLGDGTDLQNLPEVLGRIKWDMVYDCTGKDSWFLNSSVFDVQCFDPLLDSRLDSTTLVESNTQFTKVAPASQPMQAFVFPFGYSEQALEDTADTVRYLKDLARDLSFKIELFPVTSHLRAAQIIAGDQAKVCRWGLVSAVIRAHTRTEKTVILRGAHGLVGIERSESLPLRGLEVLSMTCDVEPEHPRSGSEATADVKVAEETAAAQDLAVSWQNGTPLSWYAIRHGFYVKRQLFETIQDNLRRGLSTVITHGFGDGASTLARSVLYSLRHEFVCVVVKDQSILEDSHARSSAIKSLAQLTAKTEKSALLLADFDCSTERLADSSLWGMRPLMLTCSHEGMDDSNEEERDAKFQIGKVEKLSGCSKTEEDAFQSLLARVVKTKNAQARQFATESTNSLQAALDATGLIRWGKVDMPIKKRLGKMEDGDLITQQRLFASEIVSLRTHLKFTDTETDTMDKEFEAKHPFYFGLIGMLVEQKRRAKEYLRKLLPRLVEEECFLLKVCLFQAMFSPGCRVSKRFLQIVTGRLEISPRLGLVLSEVVDGSVSILPRLAYLLCELSNEGEEGPILFGTRARGGLILIDPLDFAKELVGMQRVQNVAHRQQAQLELVDTYMKSFVEFKIWHPEQPKNVKQDFSFLVGLIKQIWTPAKARGLLQNASDVIRKTAKDGVLEDAKRCVKISLDLSRFLIYNCDRLCDGRWTMENRLSCLEDAKNCVMAFRDSADRSIRASVAFALGLAYRKEMQKILEKEELGSEYFLEAVRCYCEAMENFNLDARHPHARVAAAQASLTLLMKMTKAFVGPDADRKFDALTFLTEGKRKKFIDEAYRTACNKIRGMHPIEESYQHLYLAQQSLQYRSRELSLFINKEMRKIKQVRRQLDDFVGEKMTDEAKACNMLLKDAAAKGQLETFRLLSKIIFNSDQKFNDATWIEKLFTSAVRLEFDGTFRNERDQSLPEDCFKLEKWDHMAKIVSNCQKIPRLELLLYPVAFYLARLLDLIERNGCMQKDIQEAEKLLDSSLSVLGEHAGNFFYAHKPRLFIRRDACIRGVAMTRVCETKRMPFFDSLEGHFGSDRNRIFHEEAQPYLLSMNGILVYPFAKKNVCRIHWVSRNCNLIFACNRLEGFSDGQRVSFYVGISGRGLLAQGVMPE